MLVALAAPALADTIKIGSNAPLTGFAAPDGKSARIGAERIGEQSPSSPTRPDIGSWMKVAVPPAASRRRTAIGPGRRRGWAMADKAPARGLTRSCRARTRPWRRSTSRRRAFAPAAPGSSAVPFSRAGEGLVLTGQLIGRRDKTFKCVWPKIIATISTILFWSFVGVICNQESERCGYGTCRPVKHGDEGVATAPSHRFQISQPDTQKRSPPRLESRVPRSRRVDKLSQPRYLPTLACAEASVNVDSDYGRFGGSVAGANNPHLGPFLVDLGLAGRRNAAPPHFLTADARNRPIAASRNSTGTLDTIQTKVGGHNRTGITCL